MSRIEQILGSPIRIRILRLLAEAPDRALSGRAIAEALKGQSEVPDHSLSHSGLNDAPAVVAERSPALRTVQVALGHLWETGALKRQEIGASHLYSVNWDDPLLAGWVLPLLEAERSIPEDLAGFLRSRIESLPSHLPVQSIIIASPESVWKTRKARFAYVPLGYDFKLEDEFQSVLDAYFASVREIPGIDYQADLIPTFSLRDRLHNPVFTQDYVERGEVLLGKPLLDIRF